jgi:adenylosuccinate synthase
MTRAHTVIKRGGAQGSHGVKTSRGESFNFSQWGCGTLEGVSTFLSEQMVVSPHAMLNEAEALKRMGIFDPFSMISADENALCATPLHETVSCLNELSRGKNSRGTVGTGVGVAYRLAQTDPSVAIYVRDLFSSSELREKLEAQCKILRSMMEPVIASGFLAEDQELVDEKASNLFDDEFLEYTFQRFMEVASKLRIAKLEEILSRDGVTVVETSHGVLTDAEVGLRPHTSAIRTLPSFTCNMLRGAGFEGKIVNIGVSRAYAIRHGAGPLPTHDLSMIDSMLPGSHKDDNRWQGKARMGPMDFVLLKYAIDQCGGPSVFDGLAITWADQIVSDGVWRFCERYQSPLLKSSSEDLTKQLFEAVPEISSLPINTALSQEENCKILARLVSDKTQIPVRMMSFGSTELEKILIS